MNKYKLFKAGINANEGIKRFNGSVEIYEEYLFKFLNDVNFSALCKAIEDKNVTAAFAAAHALKGVAGNLSFDTLHNDISPLVEHLRDNRIERASELLKPVAEDYQNIINTLKEMK